MSGRSQAQHAFDPDALANVVVFVPFGLALGLLLWRPDDSKKKGAPWGWWWRVTGSGFVLSLSIELAQFLIPGRTSDVQDLMANTLGTMIGAAVTGLLIVKRGMG